MIDYDFEDRLIRRLDAKRAIQSTLTTRQRNIFKHRLRGLAYKEIADDEGITVECIRQIFFRSCQIVTRAVMRDEANPVVTPEAFDKRAFLDHMRHLIKLRAAEERWRFERERARLAIMVQQELEPPPPPPPPAPPPVWNPPVQPGQWAKIKLPVQYAVSPANASPNAPSASSVFYGTNYEPARPFPVPSVSELTGFAHNALECFRTMREGLVPYELSPVQFQGNRRSTVTFPRQGGILAHAMERLAHEVSADGYMSVYPLELPATMLGATATNDFASVTVTVSKDLSQLAIHTPWYLPNAAP